jgi:hypothetical protein
MMAQKKMAGLDEAVETERGACAAKADSLL